MTIVVLTRPASQGAQSVHEIREKLRRRLHAPVSEPTWTLRPTSMTATLDVTAPADLVRIACAAVVDAPVTWEVP